MPRPEDDQRFQRDRARFTRREQGASLVLLPELREWLRGHEYACLLATTTLGTVFVLKAPRPEIESVRGPVPLALRHEVYDHPAAPVVRSLMHLYDRPTEPLAMEAFTNVADPAQRADLARLTTQELIYLFFYDDQVNHQLTKGVRLTQPHLFTEILQTADELLRGIDPQRFDFDQAKAAVQRQNPLG